MYLYAVEACLDSVARRLGVQLSVFFNLRNRKFARDNRLSVAGTRPAVIEGDRAGGDEIKATFLPEDGRIGSTSKGPKLEEDVRAVGVNGIRNLCAVNSVHTVVVGRGETQTVFHPAICASFQIPGTFAYPPA